MAGQGEGGSVKEEVKTQFVTREGVYKLLTLSEYSRPNRVAFNGVSNTPVKTSFVTHKETPATVGDKICFNVGKELYVYNYKGVRKAPDLTKPIDKRVYKATFPTCHDINSCSSTSDTLMVLIGFTAGQIQLIDPIRKELSKLYNEERQIDKTKVTCIKWLPGSPNMFLVAYASGQLYVYNEEVTCQPTPPQYQLFKQGDSFSVYTCKTKCTRNPIYRWVVGEGAISEFAFSPCGQFLAVASADGFLRIFDYNAMELLDKMRSYFGGLTCVCWSPDGRYVVTGGEDDLVTVWSVQERRVVCRGQGHKSWVNVVAFDSYTTSCSSNGDIGAINNSVDFSGSDDDISHMSPLSPNSVSLVPHDEEPLSYRFGSIGQDTMLCLWDITEDILRQPLMKHWTNNSLQQGGTVSKNNSCSSVSTDARMADSNSTVTQSTGVSHRFGALSINSDKKDKDLVGGDKKEHKRSASLASKNSDKPLSVKNNGAKAAEETAQYLGSPSCPHLDELPMLEPLVCKKIAHERLTDLHFREDCIVVSCQEGYVYTWARPGTALSVTQHLSASPQQSAGSTAL